MLIKTEGLHKHFDRVHVLKGISMEVQKAEIISVVGASGAGKTTLLQILGTLEKPDQGKVTMEGTDLFRLSSSETGTFPEPAHWLHIPVPSPVAGIHSPGKCLLTRNDR